MVAGSAVIFDVDGVLVDSYDAHLASWQRLARETGVRFTESDFARTFGRTSADIIRECWPPSDHEETRIRALDDRKEALYREIVSADFPAMPGARELIGALAEAGFRLAAGSSGPPENVQLALDRLGVAARFDAMVTGRDVERGKPDPQVFLVASERVGVAPDRCVVVEDAPAGIMAACRAGMAAFGLASKGRDADSLKDAGASLVAETLGGFRLADFRSILAACGN